MCGYPRCIYIRVSVILDVLSRALTVLSVAVALILPLGGQMPEPLTLLAMLLPSVVDRLVTPPPARAALPVKRSSAAP